MLRLALVVVLAQLGGCFFVFIPGSLKQKISDSFTGAEGAHCVARHVKVGDHLTLADGKTIYVKSLSGESINCADPNLPIRALLQ